jgi:uncharacterized membrane protein
MTMLILGLAIFLGTHSVRIFADDWRARQIARLGEIRWKAVYSVIALIGFVLIIWGYGLARAQPVVLWTPPSWGRHLAGLLNAIAFVLLAAAYVRGNSIKAGVGHPMVLSVKVWAFAHLLTNGSVHAILLFGSFLLWAVGDFAAARRRDRKAGTVYPAGSLARDALVVVVGVVLAAVFALLLHGWLIGVRPYG